MSAGAKEMMTPSDVIATADITFSCVSDPQVAKNVSSQIKLHFFQDCIFYTFFCVMKATTLKYWSILLM